MSRYYKCDLCGTPYAPQPFDHTTAYIETGNKTFDGKPSNIIIRDVCPECKCKLLDFMATLAPKEDEDGGN